MQVLREERHWDGQLVLQVIQEFPGAGLNWRYKIAAGILPAMTQTSSGRFYQDQHGEVIHGATLEDVIERAMSAVKSLFPSLKEGRMKNL